MILDRNVLISALGKQSDSPDIERLKRSLDSSFVKSDSHMIDRYYLECLERGVSLTLTNGRLSSVHLYLNEEDGFEHFSGWIGDDFTDQFQSYETVCQLMGKPNRTGGGEKGFMGKVDPCWLRYDFEDYSIHYTFSNDNETISLVTLMTTEFAP